MRKAVLYFAAVVLCLASTLTSAQEGYFANWFARVDKTKDEQPHWVTPLATTTPRLEEEYRYDQLWQTNAKGITTNNYDGGKGLELIPFEKVEVIFNVPPYLVHNDPRVRDGFGDVAFLIKYRLLSANEDHGSYILTAFLGWSLSTGDHKNGAAHAVITPTIAYGKGFGNFDLQGTFGVGLPTADMTPTCSDETMRGTTLFNIACIGSSGPKLNSTRHSFRMEKTTVRSRIS
jgi:hypothetical protein